MTIDTQQAGPAFTAASTRYGSLTVRAPTMDAPWRWLSAGLADVRRAPLWSLGYGFVFVAFGLAVTAGFWGAGVAAITPAFAAGFGLLGPMLAVGLYEISRRLAAGEPLSLRGVLLVRTGAPVQLALLSFFLMFLFLVWMRVAMLLYALFSDGNYVPLGDFAAFVLGTPAGLALLVVGTGVGGCLALLAFAMTVLAVPTLVRRDVDAVTAIIASVGTVIRHPGPMLLWAWLIAVLVAFGLATMLVGLVFVFPLLGHATWHAWRDLVDGPT